MLPIGRIAETLFSAGLQRIDVSGLGLVSVSAAPAYYAVDASDVILLDARPIGAEFGAILVFEATSETVNSSSRVLYNGPGGLEVFFFADTGGTLVLMSNSSGTWTRIA